MKLYNVYAAHVRGRVDINETVQCVRCTREREGGY